MFCPQCRQLLPDDAHFCFRCGAPMYDMDDAQEDPVPPQAKTIGLTEEDRQRIAEEESLRAEVRKREAEGGRAIWGWGLTVGGSVLALTASPVFWLAAGLGVIILWTTAGGRAVTLWLIIGLILLVGAASAGAGGIVALGVVALMLWAGVRYLLKKEYGERSER